MKTSASNLELRDACAASGALPHVSDTGVRAERGTQIHAYLTRLSQGKPQAEALALVPEEYRSVCAELPDPGLGLAEVAFAYDVESGQVRELGRDIGREYGELARSEIPGTADLIQMVGETLELTDYKTGRMEITPARENLQLHFLALCAARRFGARVVRVRLFYVHEDGGTHVDSHELDAFDLAEVAARVRRIWERVRAAQAKVNRGEVPDLREGAHCKYCPARRACPAKVGWLVRLGSPEVVRAKFGQMLSPEQAAQAVEMVERAQEVVKDLRAQLDDYARANPIPLPDGKVYGLTTYQRESVSGPVTYEALSSLHGEAVARAACELSATKASIERALKTIAPRGALASYKRKAEEEIRERGGIEVKVTETVRAHEPEEEKRAANVR